MIKKHGHRSQLDFWLISISVQLQVIILQSTKNIELPRQVRRNEIFQREKRRDMKYDVTGSLIVAEYEVLQVGVVGKCRVFKIFDRVE